MIMKRQIITWGMMLAAAFTLTNCAKEIENPNEQPETTGYPFEIVASTVDTKTVNDGLSTNWVAEDQINLFHAVSGGTTFVNNNAFTVNDVESGRFTGSLYEALVSGNSYDWYAFYPYSEYITTPASQTEGWTYVGCRSDRAQTQSGLNSMAHIAGDNYPLYGKALSVHSASRPELTMYHASALLKINVTNSLETDLDVTSISFVAPEGISIVGQFYPSIVGETVEFTDATYVSNIANLTVEGATIPAGESASFYLAVKPFEAPAASTFTLSVNGLSKESAGLESPMTFHAGKIKTLNFSYDYVAPAGEKSVTFDFTSEEELTNLNITLPQEGSGTTITTISKGDVSLSANGGSTNTRIYNSSGSYDLRAYKGATLTLSVSDGYVINDIIIEGGEISDISYPILPNNPVVLTIADNADTQKISTITVKYMEGEVVAVPLTMESVTCVNKTSSTLTFSWNPVSGAEGYMVSLDGGNTFGELFVATSYTWENLNPESEYTIYVKAVGNSINTLDSEAVSAQGTTEAEQEGVVTKSANFTFTGQNGQNDFSVTQAPIKIAFAKANGSYAPNDHSEGHVRIYKGNTMTFTGGTIVKIELKYSGTKYTGAGMVGDVGILSQDTDDGMWTWLGEATTITLTGGATQGRYDSITVYYESDGTLPAPIQLTMSDITCSAQTANSLTFKWEAVTNATKYEVIFNNGSPEEVSTPTYEATGLEAETEYTISVKAVGDGTSYLTSDAKTSKGTTSSTGEGDLPSIKTYSWTASSGALGTTMNGTVTINLNGIDWNVERSGDGYTGWTNSCIQIGKKGGVETLKLTTQGISGVVKSVKVECSSYQAKHSVSISVGGIQYVSTATSSWTTVGQVTGTGTSSGDIQISFTPGTGARALYVKSITIEYEN